MGKINTLNLIINIFLAKNMHKHPALLFFFFFFLSDVAEFVLVVHYGGTIYFIIDHMILWVGIIINFIPRHHDGINASISALWTAFLWLVILTGSSWGTLCLNLILIRLHLFFLLFSCLFYNIMSWSSSKVFDDENLDNNNNENWKNCVFLWLWTWLQVSGALIWCIWSVPYLF